MLLDNFTLSRARFIEKPNLGSKKKNKILKEIRKKIKKIEKSKIGKHLNYKHKFTIILGRKEWKILCGKKAKEQIKKFKNQRQELIDNDVLLHPTKKSHISVVL